LILLCLYPVRGGPDNFLKIPAHDPPPRPKRSGQGGVPSKIIATPLPPVFFFCELTPTSPVSHKTGDHPPMLPVPKGVFRVERPVSGGGDPTPPAKKWGGGVIA